MVNATIHATPRAVGVLPSSLAETQHEAIKEIASNCGNYVIIIAKLNNETHAFASIYGPNRDQPSFFSVEYLHTYKTLK